MELEDISKPLYRSRFNKLMIAIVVALFILALGIGQGLIALFPVDEGSHFAHNLSGVITAALIVSSLVYRYRHHPAMYEVMYVWRLKQELNRIYRKQRAVLAAVDEGDATAMTIMNFSYKGSRQLYELDDNKVTMDELDAAEAELLGKAEAKGLTLRLEDYRRGLLDNY